MFGNYNPYYNNPYYNFAQTGARGDQPFSQPSMQQQMQPSYKPSAGLQGKSVDSLDVVKAMDIPLDGSISYFPLVDGTAIVTKQLQPDGTSKTIVYKPVEKEKEESLPKYVTAEEMDQAIKGINFPEVKELKDEIKSLKRQVRDISDDIRDKKE